MSAPNEPKTPQKVLSLLGKNGPRFAKPSATSETRTGSASPLDHDTKLLINMLFARLHHIYTHRFESAYGDETTLAQAKREWAFSLAGYSRERVEYALERCKLELAWPPTIAEFCRYLEPRPEDLGLPATREAYLEACQKSHAPLQQRWSHPAVHLAARNAGHFALRSEPERITWPAFEKAYRELVSRMADGEELVVETPRALPEPDMSAEQRLVERLVEAGVEQADAYPLAYYLEKPVGSPVRARYRDRARAKLEKMGVDLTLPE